MSRGPYVWPAYSTISFYKRKTKPTWSTRDRGIDLADALMMHATTNSRTVYFGLTTKNKQWKRWNLAVLKKIEGLVKYDLGFDGYQVTITRVTKLGQKCSTEFIWKLRIRTRGF